MHTLIVAGSGIKSIAHLTAETRQVIKKADKVLYLVNENNFKAWLEREAIEAESLEPIYFKSIKRADAYKEISNYIVEQYHQVKNLCVIFYGHPTVFAQSGLDAVKQIKKEKGNAIILPAVTAMDCLFSDLEIDPGQHGCFTIDATELLIYERTLDVHGHLIIWQIANLGRADTQITSKISVLQNYLEKYYSPTHPICIYEAALLPTHKPRTDWHQVAELGLLNINPLSTLYLPPTEQKKISQDYLALLEIDPQDFQSST
ncbi:SAM-dependent methyltransferase [Legionella gresilensis]|uniref:SAM-dependent methyltransferase n=1 Tax=Legionella gresilensis TaxID=91823 RepID=UPI0010414F66|nr:SAM-dependent methyltransferase [Legionella gresilensis]